MKVDISTIPSGRHLYLAAINAHGICLGQLWRHRIAGLKLVAMVGIDSRSVALHLPVARHLNLAPSTQIGLWSDTIGWQLLIGFYEAKTPSAIQQLVVRALLVTAGACARLVRISHE